MSNPFKGKVRVPIESLDNSEDMNPMERNEAMVETLLQEESYLGSSGFASVMGAVISQAVSMAGGSLVPKRARAFFDARCGGRLKPGSIKQRTRLNRDARNRERRYAKHSTKYGRITEFNYANQ